jgi:hypothetical protein
MSNDFWEGYVPEPSAGTQVSKVWWDGEKLMAKQVPLEDFYKPAQDVSLIDEGKTALDKKAENARELGLDYEPAQQEPVNKYCCHLCFNKSGQVLLDRMILCPECGNKRCPKATHHDLPCTKSNDVGQKGSIYDQPAQRTWVSLTDEEIYKIDCLLITNITELVIAIEAKLKEKNNG